MAAAAFRQDSLGNFRDNINFVSYGALYMIAGSLSPAKIFKYFTASFSLPLLIPILMIAAGIYLLIKGVFFSKSNESE